MIDIVQEILSEERGLPPSQARVSAEAAMKLYQEAAQLCGRVDLPLSCIYTEVWNTGTPKNQNKPVSTNQLWFDPEAQHFIKRTAFAPKGPRLPFGASWLILDQRPERVKSLKQRGEEKYKVLVAYWEHPLNLGVPYQLKWSYARTRPGVVWYQGELGEFCDTCKAEVHGKNISIREGRILRCTACYDAWVAKKKEDAESLAQWARRNPGHSDPMPSPSISIVNELDVKALVEATINVPLHSRACFINSYPPRSGDTLTQRDAKGMAIQATVIRGPNWTVPLTPEATYLSYDSVMSGRIFFTFQVQEPIVNGNFRGPSPWGPRRRAPEPPGPISALVDEFRRLSPLGKAVTAGLGALALQAIMAPRATQPATKAPSLDEILGLTPAKEPPDDKTP